MRGLPRPNCQHNLRHLKGSAFQFGTADAAAADGRSGSNVYEVNLWLGMVGVVLHFRTRNKGKSGALPSIRSRGPIGHAVSSDRYVPGYPAAMYVFNQV